jgi:hypothetical protein
MRTNTTQEENTISQRFFQRENAMAKNKKQRGPKPDQLKIDGNWEDPVKEALEKKQPKGGWPKKAKKEPK